MEEASTNSKKKQRVWSLQLPYEVLIEYLRQKDIERYLEQARAELTASANWRSS